MIIGFLAEDRASLLSCSLVGNSFCSPSRVHLFVDIEVNSLQRFQRLLELSTTSLTTFDHESLKAFSSVRTISVRDAGAWITPEALPGLLFLPLNAPFPHVKDFRIDNLNFREETMPTFPTPPLHVEQRAKAKLEWGFGAAYGASANEPPADSPNFPAPSELSVVSLRTLSLRNCQVPNLRWLQRYVSYFPYLESLSLIDFTWRSVDREGADQGPTLQCRSSSRRSMGLSELTLEVQNTPPIAPPPRLLFESLSGSLRILRLVYVDIFLFVGELIVSFWASRLASA